MSTTPQHDDDSAISVVGTSSNQSSMTQASRARNRSSVSPPKSEHSPQQSGWNQLSAAEQAEQNAEGEAAVLQAQNEIDVDSGADAQSVSDAGYETDSIGTTSTSLASSYRNFAFENGRRYHRFREGSYNFPNDDLEQDREDLKHAMMMHLLHGRYHYAPIGPHPGNVLDIGTGTGIWAIEMGDLYPSADILGVDLSPIQPEWVPPNVKFMVDDVESPWLKPLNHFDYVHSRHTVMAIRDWPKLMRSVLDHLKPGGWYEMQEIHHIPYCHDGTMPPDHPVCQYWHLITEALAKLNVNFNATLLLEGIMRDSGFVNVHTRIFHVPIGLWPRNKVLKKVGLYWRTVLIDGLEPIALAPLTRGLGWSKEQVEVWLIEVRKAYMDSWVHSHMPLYITCGQKPGPGVYVYRTGEIPPWADVPIVS
ncbi:methyltransferase-containing protein [Coleophoma crateriformis]|uniref:Methyltransferase-containing protein n=1 Tax=Coleophoma crateriformis TaxID=565419 RepID=A0A3D8QYB0_9HELO|nr:methyltransferase-containing protein [Coleophoma crateriformis]